MVILRARIETLRGSLTHSLAVKTSRSWLLDSFHSTHHRATHSRKRKKHQTWDDNFTGYTSEFERAFEEGNQVPPPASNPVAIVQTVIDPITTTDNNESLDLGLDFDLDCDFGEIDVDPVQLDNIVHWLRGVEEEKEKEEEEVWEDSFEQEMCEAAKELDRAYEEEQKNDAHQATDDMSGVDVEQMFSDW